MLHFAYGLLNAALIAEYYINQWFSKGDARWDLKYLSVYRILRYTAVFIINVLNFTYLHFIVCICFLYECERKVNKCNSMVWMVYHVIASSLN